MLTVKIRAFLLAVSVGAVAPACSAQVVAFKIAARITNVEFTTNRKALSDDAQFLAEAIQVGDSVEAICAYDTSAPDSNADIALGEYVFHRRPFGLAVHTKRFVFQTDPENGHISVLVTNNAQFVEGYGDRFEIHCNDSCLLAPQTGCFRCSSLKLKLRASGIEGPLSSDCLPSSAPIIEDWSIRELIVGLISGGRGISGSVETCEITAVLITAELLPDPAWVLHVNCTAVSGGDGLSWPTAYASLQDALANAPTVGSTVIRVARGVYRPDLRHGLAAGDREAAFRLASGLVVEGGYAGLETHRVLRNPSRYPTVLDGDLRGDDSSGSHSVADNARHVVVAEGVDETACLDGFIIRGGYAQAVESSAAGDASPVVDVNACGGGLLVINARPSIRACIFQENHAGQHGGAVCVLDGSPSFVDCRFHGNNANENGGAIYACSDGIAGVRCVFAGNAALAGGAVAVSGSGTWSHCTLSNNRADHGAGFACLNSDDTAGNVRLSHCILWDGGGEISAFGSGDLNVTYTNIAAGWPGQGNIDTDPRFADSNNGDLHLKSQAGRWDANAASWVMDDVTSPCIDAGDPDSPIGYEPFPNGGRINIGAYGGTIEASKSYFGEPVCETIVAGDLNGDCRVNAVDLALLASHWLRTGADLP